jgi:5-methylcytosine-specific restriction endonuclease McrA
MLVYVVNKDGSPLMPCKPAKAKHLLTSGKAKVVNRCPFTIQLLWDCLANVQPVTCGIDKGAKQTGIACIGNGKVLFVATLKHRGDVKEKMTRRRECRRQRRSLLWYRKERFLNRASSIRVDRLPPTTLANINEVIRVVERIDLPISLLVVEDVMVDLRRLSDENLTSSMYQESNRLDENLRLATKIRDDFTCQCCHAQNVPYYAHHIVWREDGGKDSIYNLITVCKKCHHKIHKKGRSGEVRLKTGEIVTGMSGMIDQISQLTMQGKTKMYAALSQIAPVFKVFGYQTAAFRKAHSYEKAHWVDAVCVACLKNAFPILPKTDNLYFMTFRPRQTRQRYHVLPKKGKGRVLYQVNESLFGFQKGDIVKVKGVVKQVHSIYSTGVLAFRRVKGEPNSSVPTQCQLLEKSRTLNYWNTAL